MDITAANKQEKSKENAVSNSQKDDIFRIITLLTWCAMMCVAMDYDGVHEQTSTNFWGVSSAFWM